MDEMKRTNKKLVAGMALGLALVGVGFTGLTAQAAEQTQQPQQEQRSCQCPPPQGFDGKQGSHHGQAPKERPSDDNIAKMMARKGDVDESTALKLLKNGYHPRDIEVAATLAKESGKDIQKVLDMKKINNRWEDVAKSLGVDESKVRPQRPEGRDGRPGTQPPMGEPIDQDMMVMPETNSTSK